jgi:hypothetical protein
MPIDELPERLMILLEAPYHKVRIVCHPALIQWSSHASLPRTAAP